MGYRGPRSSVSLKFSVRALRRSTQGRSICGVFPLRVEQREQMERQPTLKVSSSTRPLSRSRIPSVGFLVIRHQGRSMSMTVGDFTVERLRAWGVRHVFGCPGDGINGVFGAMNRAPDKLQFVQARHEEMAASWPVLCQVYR